MKRFFNDIKYLFCAHLLGLLVMSIYRFWLFLAAGEFLAERSKGDVLLQCGAFLRGIWFDNVIACYVIILPLAVIVLMHLFGWLPKWRLKFVWLWLLVFYALAFAASASDIAYFQYFFKHLNSSIWNWAGYGGTTVGMVLGEPSYYPAIASYFVFLGLFAWMLRPARWLKSDVRTGSSWTSRGTALFVGGVLIGLCLFGIRGRMGYNPIKVSAAYYCDDAFLNQLGINPAFNLLLTTLDDRRPENRELHLIDVAEARENTEAILGRPLRFTLHAPDTASCRGRNVVLILMESMSADLMHRGWTPFLDSLAAQSISFENCYSAGCHTNHGIFSTLYSFPALMFRNLMKGTNIPNYEGLPTVLRDAGYGTLFFMTHESQYDNMNAFLRTNGFDEIHAQEDYPAEKVANSFGVQDDYLFEYANRRLAEVRQPFFATLLTISNHPPYVIPQWFKPRAEKSEEQIVEYADHALRGFFEEARRHAWYDSTVFVLLGDHGKLLGKSENEMPQSMNHVPWLIHIPGGVPKSVKGWAMQTDVQPTLLSLLGISAGQEHFGVNALEEKRRMALYTADNVIGARTGERLYIYEPSTKSEWFYVTDDSTGITPQADLSSPAEQATMREMRRQLFSVLQTAQEEIKKHE